MSRTSFFALLPAAFIAFGGTAASAGTSVEEAGVLVCINDKWDEKEVEKGHKLVDYAGRCVDVPNDATKEKFTEDCAGKYEYMPDGSWKSAGTCTLKFKSGDQVTDKWEEGSNLKEYPFTYTGGTGKYKGVSGGGTYFYENLTDTLAAGHYTGKMELP